MISCQDGAGGYSVEMQRQDRLFIVLAVVLMILFVAKISLNVPGTGLGFFKKAEGLSRQEGQKKTDEIMASLRQAGLEPREVKYYRVINE